MRIDIDQEDWLVTMQLQDPKLVKIVTVLQKSSVADDEAQIRMADGEIDTRRSRTFRSRKDDATIRKEILVSKNAKLCEVLPQVVHRVQFLSALCTSTIWDLFQRVAMATCTWSEWRTNSLNTFW